MKTIEQIRADEDERIARRKVDMMFKIDPATEARLRRFVVAKGMSMSLAVRAALKDYLDSWGAE